MAERREVSIRVPAAVAERIAALAVEEQCSPSELILEAVRRYDDVGVLVRTVASGGDRSDALDELLMQQVDRIVHQDRAERRDAANHSRPGERRAS